MFSISAAKVFFSLLLVVLLTPVSAQEINYSLWPQRPPELERAQILLREGKTNEACALLDPFLFHPGIIGKDARAIVGPIRLQQWLSPYNPENVPYFVQRGEGLANISKKLRCPIDMMMQLNQSMSTALSQGQKLLYRPMNLELEINLPLKELIVRNGGKFLISYPIKESVYTGSENTITAIKAKQALLGVGTLSPTSAEYTSANKNLLLSLNKLVIDANSKKKDKAAGFYLATEDINELSLICAPTNSVSIITTAEKH